jgi:hypothetical protein
MNVGWAGRRRGGLSTHARRRRHTFADERHQRQLRARPAAAAAAAGRLPRELDQAGGPRSSAPHSVYRWVVCCQQLLASQHSDLGACSSSSSSSVGGDTTKQDALRNRLLLEAQKCAQLRAQRPPTR